MTRVNEEWFQTTPQDIATQFDSSPTDGLSTRASFKKSRALW